MSRMMPSRRIERISSLVKHPLPRSVYIFACSNMRSSCPTSKSLLGRSLSTRDDASRKSNPSPGMLEWSSLENPSLVDASIDWIRQI